MKIQSPWMGRIKGSAGNMTGCKMHDKNVMRAKAFEVNNPNTPAQQVQRGYFADLTKLVAGFTPDQLRTLFPSKPKAMSRRNALSKQLAEYNTIENNEKVIDFANIDTLGNAPTATLPEVNVSIGSDTLSMVWNSENYPNQSLLDNKVVLFVKNKTREQILLLNTNVPYDENEFQISTPQNWFDEDEMSAFMLISDTTQLNADFGSFIIKVRPEKKSN